MKIVATSVDDYISKIPTERVEPFEKLRKSVLGNIPAGFEETIGYNMPAYVVPLSVYPDGYHCQADTPLPFASIASQKNFIAFYHMGIYAIPKLKAWFEEEYAKRVPTKLDMGKSCIRLKKMDQIPYDLFGELMAKVTPTEWISIYEANMKK